MRQSTIRLRPHRRSQVSRAASRLITPSHQTFSPPRELWLPPLRIALPVFVLMLGLMLILIETALFLALHERHTVDAMTQRASREGAMLARLTANAIETGQPADASLELRLTKAEAGVEMAEFFSADATPASPGLRVPQDGSPALQEILQAVRDAAAQEGKIVRRSAKGDAVIAVHPVRAKGGARYLALVYDLAAPLREAFASGWYQALIGAAVLALGSLILWALMDAALGARTRRLMERADAIAAGGKPGPTLSGGDELAEVDRALRDAHLKIAEQTAARTRLEQDIIRISEREQRRIGQDLHDDLCQRLAAVKMKVQDLEEKLVDTAPGAIRQAEAIAGNLSDAIAITRALARGLSPVDIESGGLVVALSGLARGMSSVFGLDCRFAHEGAPPDVGPHAATQLYRIAQECVTNAARHARASRVMISLATRADHLELRVANDGAPMPARDADSSSAGMGTHIMRYRARSVGAALEFDTSPPDATTAVICRLPLDAPLSLSPSPSSPASS